MANDLGAALAALRAAYGDRVARVPPEPAQRLSGPPSAPEDVPEWLARDLAEERAAIMEFCGGMNREDAEAYVKKR